MTRRDNFEHSFYEWNAGTHRSVAYSGYDGEGAYADLSVRPDRHWVRADPDQNFGQGPQGTLFLSRPAENRVVGLYASRGARHAVPTLLGLIGHKSMRETGRLPQASDNLSVHSAPIVRNLVERGAIANPQPGPRVRAKNAIRMDDETSTDAMKEAEGVAVFGQKVDPKDVRMGQQFIRSVLRRPRERVPGQPTELFPSAAYKKGAK